MKRISSKENVKSQFKSQIRLRIVTGVSGLCLVPRRLSLDENVRAKEGGKETTGETALRPPSVPFPWSLAVHHQSFAFRARLYDEKNEAPEEEAALGSRTGIVIRHLADG